MAERVTPDFATIYSDARTAMMNDMTGQDIDHHLVITAFAAGRQAQHAFDTRSLPQAGEGVEEMVAKAICSASGLGKPDDLMGVMHCPNYKATRPYRWEQHIAQARAAIAALPPAGRVEEDTVEAIATAVGTEFERWFNGERDHGDELDLRPAIRTALTGKVHP